MYSIAVNGSYPKIPDPPRPPLLLRAIENYKSGKIDEKELKRAKERATVDAVAEMVAAGVEIVSDGQIRWDGSIIYICRGLQGFADIGKGNELESDNGHQKPRVVDKIHWSHPILVDDYRFISSRSPVDVRPVVIGPFTIARLCNPGTYGRDIISLTDDLARALNREILGLEDAGAKYILVDEPLLTFTKGEISSFCQAAELLCEGVEANIMLATSQGDVVGIEEELLATPFGGFALDMLNGPDNEKLLVEKKNKWAGRIIQLGLVNSFNPEVERPTTIARELLRFSDYHDPELIWVAPTGGLGSMLRDIAFAKLRCLYMGVQKARREIARLERPGGSLPENN